MLFKYLPEERLDVLENLKIRYSPFKSLNDPYESLPAIYLDSVIRKFVDEQTLKLDELWAETDICEKTDKNKAKYESLRNNLEHEARKLMTSSKAADYLMESFSDTFGVLSLSRTNLSLLMWAHYASSYSGYVIGFNEDHEFFHQPTLQGEVTQPVAVKYSDKRLFVKATDPNVRNKLFANKPLEWAYEQEERIFLAGMDKRKSSGHVDEFGIDVILQNIPAKAISEIYIGSRASSNTRVRINEAIRKNKISCRVFETKMSESEYRIEFKEINV